MKGKLSKKIELLAPAGSVEKMKYAFAYGADAVYAGVPDFSLRARINDFDWNSLKNGVEYAHKLGKKFYVTLNIYAHNVHLKKLEEDLEKLKEVNSDAVLISDPGVLEIIKEKLPKVEIHLSTQANATNWRAVKFWADQKITRVVLAREVTLDEIKEIKKNVPNVELEYFVHGAMCMSYSGRCMLSKWMRGRSANLGDCVQPCRWAYNDANQRINANLQIANSDEEVKTMNVVDHQGEFEMEVEQDKQGTYFFNSKDLNLIEHSQSLADAGVESFKIEGRNKSVYYLAVVVRAYRNVLDATGKENYKKVLKQEKENLDSLFHRGYTQGFLLGEEPEHNFKNSHDMPKYEFVGEITNDAKQRINANPRIANDACLIGVRVHNAIYLDDEVEIIDKNGNHKVKLEKIFNENMEEVQSAHGGHGKNYFLQVDRKNIQPMSLIRKVVK